MKNQKGNTNHKGFTLVELIVVIVILAILAAILIPGLLKWIDQAKRKQYELEARNIYLATSASLVELHGLGGFEHTQGGASWDLAEIEHNFLTFDSTHNPEMFAYIKKMSGIDGITYIRCYIDIGEMKALAIRFTSPSDGETTIQATMKKEKNYTIYTSPDNEHSWTWPEDETWNIEVID